MRKLTLVLATTATLGVTAMAPSPVHARGPGPAMVGGLIAGALIAGAASNAYAYGPGYGSYYGDGYAYYSDGYPASYGSPVYSGPVYGGPYYRKGYRPGDNQWDRYPQQ